ncbi:hypothetical protein FIBSPDRAFT_1042298 [Athelia psychrophila]|uniref:F-box domain-containing protein n=1 Tax=Athelia psychrophila TaxID=1759441 RepID=A0A166MRA9_9AGAM|nr:hypothetical protein FIBSPDRAFT_1042298 [Fibularhizoctonia sp. CBS 109695]
MLVTHPSSRSLPVEVLDQVIDLTSRSDQACLLRINPTFNSITRRILYRSISLELTCKCITLLRTLSGGRRKYYAHLVHTLEIPRMNHPIGNFYHLLHRALLSLSNLTSLSVPGHPLDLKGCTFSLTSLSVDCRVGSALAAFLALHPHLEELCIRGGVSHDDPMPLPPSTIPNLNTLRLLHSDPTLLADIVRGRPVRFTSNVIMDTCFMPTIEALALSSAPMARASTIFFECPDPVELFTAFASRFPEIEALHVVVLSGPCLLKPLKTATPLLSSFKKLKFITFMAGQDPTETGEREVAEMWQKACPSLSTIILPNGVVWFCNKQRGQCTPLPDVHVLDEES